jgi:hypothetical protein
MGKRAGSVAQVIGHLFSKIKVLGLNPSTTVSQPHHHSFLESQTSGIDVTR